MFALAERVRADELPAGAVDIVPDEATLESRVSKIVEKLVTYSSAQAQAMGGRGAGRGVPNMPMMPGMPGAMPGMMGGPQMGRGGFPQQGGRGGFQGGPGRAPEEPRGRAPNRAAAPAGSTVDVAALQAAPPAQQKQMLGEALYPKIHAQEPELGSAHHPFSC